MMEHVRMQAAYDLRALCSAGGPWQKSNLCRFLHKHCSELLV